jgi:hypothetical protein
MACGSQQQKVLSLLNQTVIAPAERKFRDHQIRRLGLPGA